MKKVMRVIFLGGGKRQLVFFVIVQQMSENSDKVWHREVIPYISTITTPYTTYQALIEYWGLLDSKKLWCKLYKHLSIIRKVSIENILNSFSSIDQSDPIEEVEGQWSIMAILTLLVHVWIRLGKRKQMAYGEQIERNLQISIDIYQQSKESALEISVNFPKYIFKEDWSILLYHQIQFYCSQYSLLFQESPSKALFLKSKSILKIQDIEMPSIIQIQKYSRCHLILNNSKQAAQTYGIEVLDYLKILFFLNRKRTCRDKCSLFEFAEEYFKQMQKIRYAADKVMKYYYVITPDDILVIDRQKIPFFQVLKKPIPCMILNSSSISEKDIKSVYAYKGDTSERSKHSEWSAALSFLCVISKYESRALFQSLLSKSIQNGTIAIFIKKQITRLQSQRQFDSELVMATLTNWLNTDITSINVHSKDIADNNFFMPSDSSKVNVQNKLNVQNKFSWLEDLLKESKPNKTSFQSKEIFEVKDIEIVKDAKEVVYLEQIRNITSVTPKEVIYLTEKEQNQYYIDYVLNSAPQNTENVININGRQIILTFKKPQIYIWKQQQSELISQKNAIQNAQNNSQKQESGAENKYNIICMKISRIQNGNGDYSGLSIENLEELGYQLQQIRKGSGKCEMCQRSVLLSEGTVGQSKPFQLFTPKTQAKRVQFILEDFCGHRQCLKCYQQYIQQQIKNNKGSPINCFNPQCQKVISIGILQEMAKHNNFLKNDLIETLIRMKTPSISLRRCLNPKCQANAAFFTLQKGNRVFYCQNCSNYLCCVCLNIFHGGMSCQQFERRTVDLKTYLQSQLIGIYKFKKEWKKVNEVSLNKILRQLKINSAVFLDELEALLKVCMAEIWANNQKISFDIIQPQSIYFLEDIVESLKLSLLIFHQKTHDIGAKSNNELKTLAMEIKDISSNLLSLKHYESVILYKSCQSSIPKPKQSQAKSINSQQQ